MGFANGEGTRADMTLTTVSRYVPGQDRPAGERAVVVGSGMAGLAAARVLTDHFETVTIVERDSLPDDPIARRGVPQAGQPHVLLEAGRATLEDLFPGFTAGLREAGGQTVDGAADLNMYAERGYLAPPRREVVADFASRPLYEQQVRQQVLDLDRVWVRPNCQFLAYRLDRGSSTVTGVRVLEGGEEQVIDADLVVDATGRTSRTPSWLAECGYPEPAVEEVRIDLAYATTAIERPSDDRRAYLMQPTPPRTRGGTVLPVEDDRWLVTMHGIHGDHPPTDDGGFRDFAESLPVPELSALLRDHPRTTDQIDKYPVPSNRRYRYDALDRFPDGLVVVGDAMASFNPIYGQGMSVATLKAVLLHHALADGGLDGLWDRFVTRAWSLVDIAWLMAVGADFRFPQTRGPKPRGTPLFNRYLARLVQGAHTDGALTDAFQQVIMMERPPTTLFYPRVLWHVLRPAG